MQTLAQQIEHAFPAGAAPRQLSRYPGNDDDATRFHRGKRWIELSAKELRETSDAVGYFTAEALAYFAPAYMTAYLTDPAALDMAVESFLLSLGANPNTPSPELERASEVKLLFTDEQRNAVEAFITYYLNTQGSCAYGIVEPAMAMYGIVVQGDF